MKQLDEMERMATSRVESEQRDLRDIAECRRMEALNTLTGAARDATIGAAALGRLLLAVIPVVRAAEALAGTNRHLSPLHLRPLADAVDEMRRRLGGE